MEDRWNVLFQGLFRMLVICLVLAIFFPVYEADFTGKVFGQTEPVVCLVGEDVILPCTLRNNVSTVNAVKEAVEWQKMDLTQKDVHFYTDSRDSNMDQIPSYRGRTSLFKEELRKGNISLKLTSVKLSDAGEYSCSVPSLHRNEKAFIQLKVGAVSQPVISIMGPKDDGVVLKCESGGWYPEPKMTWLDSDGSILPDGPIETQIDSEGRYTVRGEVTIQKTDNNKFTCRVNQLQINQMKETEMNIPGDVVTS
ncbi:hypothetical protein UPYG_G00246750 [Umbra pygmaea]|uniref:Ig-like domain-containing protein n=1 Tax=Umbra pygmaea TaxID=75934 RepID=A0ABD0WL72_UMBPY